jgi:hypothetical protein
MSYLSEDFCIICLMNTININSVTSCEHKFCSSCIRRWYEINSSCPVCRINIILNYNEVNNYIEEIRNEHNRTLNNINIVRNLFNDE